MHRPRIGFRFPWNRPRFYFATLEATELLKYVYRPYSTIGRLLLSLIRIKLLRRLLVRRLGNEPFIHRLLTQNSSCAVVVGSNPNRIKYILVYPCPDNESLRFKKIAPIGSAGRSDIIREKRILNFISKVKTLKKIKVPEVIEYRCGENVSLTTAEVTAGEPEHTFFKSRLPTLEDVEDFCIYVHDHTRLRIGRRSSLLGFVETRVGRLLNRNDVLELGEAISVDVSLAHCDFTPWNVRINEEFFLMIDFETCRLRMPPFYDFVHFWYVELKLLRLSPDEVIIDEAIRFSQNYRTPHRQAMIVAFRFYFGLLFLRGRIDQSLLLKLVDC